MPETDYKKARNYIEAYYGIKRQELVALEYGLHVGKGSFERGLAEKEKKSLGQQLFEAAFGLAVSAVPGGFYISRTWKALHQANPAFAERIQYAQTNIIEAAKQTHGVLNAAAGRGKVPRNAQIRRNAERLFGALLRGGNILAKEEAAMKAYLVEIDDQQSGGLEAHIRDLLGELTPYPTEELMHQLSLMYEYELFRSYCAANVRVTKYDAHDRAVYGAPVKLGYKVEGLNSGQLEHIYEQFGTKKVSEEKARTVIAGEVQPFIDAENRSEFGRLIRQRMELNTKTQTPMWPIENPMDIVRHWGAKLVHAQRPIRASASRHF